MEKILDRGKKIIFGPQTSILSAASVILVMMMVSRVLGYFRFYTITHHFIPARSALFFAAFRLPDSIFEVLVFGTFSSAFIPVFARLIRKGNGEAWDTAGRVTNLGLLFFIPLAALAGIFAEPLYRILTPGFDVGQIKEIAQITRILLLAQVFFIISYVLTGVLESLHRFLIPALAPLFYNLGIILTTIFLAPTMGLMAPAIGAVIGAIAHLLIQLPLAMKMGFRFSFKVKPTVEVKKIGRLAAPRLVDALFQQVAKMVELNLSSIISSASYTYLTLANTLQVLPVSLFGTTVAKAALPTLSEQGERLDEFKKTLLSTLYQVMFLVFPIAVVFIVLRIPLVRLAFGTDLFDWESTVQTSLVLSSFAVSIPFQAAVSILNRAYFALHDTKTPVYISITGVLITIISSVFMVRGLGLPVWALAWAYSMGVIIQSLLLFVNLEKKLKNMSFFTSLLPITKSLVASIVSGVTMYLLIKIFDRSVWIKRLSFVNTLEIASDIPFQNFVLDTRYTVNLLILFLAVTIVGAAVYIVVSFLLKSQELFIFIKFIKRFKPGLVSSDKEDLLST